MARRKVRACVCLGLSSSFFTFPVYGAPQYGVAPPVQYGQPAYAQPGLAPPPKIANAWYASYFTSMQPHERMEAQAWFQAIDRDRSGTITANEIAGGICGETFFFLR
jgi:hypothetical protein